MQNRYAGDVGDFGKYGLLRFLCGAGSEAPLRLGVVWYLFPDESHNADGKFISYLSSTDPRFRMCNPELYDGLKRLLFDSNGDVVLVNRNLRAMEASGVLPEGSIFYNAPLAFAPASSFVTRQADREKWMKAALDETAFVDLVFLDPDNGIECKSVRMTGNKGPKYVYWMDIERFAQREQSLIIYHHLNRQRSHVGQVKALCRELLQRLPAGYDVFALTFRRGSSRTYFIASTPMQRELLRERAAQLMASAWGLHFVAEALSEPIGTIPGVDDQP